MAGRQCSPAGCQHSRRKQGAAPINSRPRPCQVTLLSAQSLTARHRLAAGSTQVTMLSVDSAIVFSLLLMLACLLFGHFPTTRVSAFLQVGQSASSCCRQPRAHDWA